MVMAYRRPMSGLAHVYALPQPMSHSEAFAVAKRLELSDPSIEFAEPDVIQRPLAVPNDPMVVSSQWHYYAPNPAAKLLGGINAPLAWDISRGQGVIVAVLDTGIVSHPDLAANVIQGYDFVSDPLLSNDGNGRDADPSDPGDFVPANYCGPGEAAADSSWHGTHVAGTIAAVANNGQGVAGVAYEARVLNVRVLGRCGGSTSDIADGMRWAAGLPVPGVPNNPNPAKVLNLSLGGMLPCGPTYQSAVTAVVSSGAMVVASTGNEYSGTIGSPANCSGALAVTAHTFQGDSADYANIGPGTSISAPGGGPCTTPNSATFTCLSSGNVVERWIWSTGNLGTAAPAGSTYVGQGWQGTSMAAPHVAGVAALLFSKAPTLTVSEARFLLTSSARPFPANTVCALLSNGACGAGMLDAKAALDRQADRVPSLTAAASASVAVGGSTVTMTAVATPRNGGGGAFTYSWTQVAGPLVSLVGANAPTASFVAMRPGGMHTFEVTAHNENGYGTKQTVNVRSNNPPSIAPSTMVTVVQGSPLSFRVTATDPENDPITYIGGAMPVGATFSAATGEFNWLAADGAVRTIPMTVSVTDGVATSGGVINITVTAPTAPTTAPVSGSANAPSSGGGGSVGWLALALLLTLPLIRHAHLKRLTANRRKDI